MNLSFEILETHNSEFFIEMTHKNKDLTDSIQNWVLKTADTFWSVLEIGRFFAGFAGGFFKKTGGFQNPAGQKPALWTGFMQ